MRMKRGIMKARAKKDDFLAKIIHDLKTPATAQIRALELFLASIGDKIPQEDRELIELTLNSCNYMQNLIETFSAVNRLEYEKIHLHYKKFGIKELVEDIIKELKVLFKYHELKISLNSPKEIIINADKLQIKRVIMNILSNSINHAYRGSTVSINISKMKNKLKLEIKNNSPFIKPEILEEIFEKYKTHPTTHTTVGVGLGLYLSKEIIHAHYGCMISKSYSDDINIFGFEMPID